ncbi:glutathione S-transferase N-terminal domain-containing protein [Aquincola sp. S2]|uniref:Glutathione S-transferase N-terminal domain-containing protein n=1 Tax=Pseudaquabacterium terrae TaxID=2732868 RepID=A0ABX2EF39_9BURK|nr:glutathione S-transferase N-terminal domain-containing protein [Aquabacterium terrae]NRF67233.1 glutathione S-transferase N-terminal domain-containing protein [Aquabacterium terrae]
MNKNLDLLSSGLASSLRLWRGTWGDRPAKAAQELLILYDREDGAECRLVREALTELNLDAMVYPCPSGGKRFAAQRKKAAPDGSAVPVLVDPNSGQKLAGADDIVSYLFERYLDAAPPAGLKASAFNLLASRLAGIVRGPRGLSARPSTRPKKALVLYSFESSPFSRPVRERLCELELPYRLVNLGKLQWSDMGPSRPRVLAPGSYKPVAGSKRDVFFKEHGRVQVPYLVDPNRDVGMFESRDILEYLERTYAK